VGLVDASRAIPSARSRDGMSFDRLARPYRALELLLAGTLLQRCRTAYLSQTAHVRHALICGEGPGRYLVEFAKCSPAAQITCLDASPAMLAAAKRRCRAKGVNPNRIHFTHCDIRAWSGAAGQFDLIATHFFLDCFPPDQLADVIGRIAACAAPDALWALSDFCEPDHGWRRVRARIILALAYRFFRVATNLPASRLAAPDPFLEEQGFQLCQRRVLNYGLLHADLWSLPRSHFVLNQT
jgi:SAM-dependent methyltransferase